MPRWLPCFSDESAVFEAVLRWLPVAPWWCKLFSGVAGALSFPPGASWGSFRASRAFPGLILSLPGFILDLLGFVLGLLGFIFILLGFILGHFDAPGASWGSF